MTGFEKIKEESLYNVWLNKEFKNPLKTNSYDEIEVLNPGEQNTDSSGPDFTNAKIRIGNVVYVGDVEIDGDITDWKTHGHNINSRYNKVVLHLALTNKYNHAYVYNREGRKIPSVTLRKNISSELLQQLNFHNREEKQHNHRLKCDGAGADIEFQTAENFVKKLGAERFKKKANRIFARLKELSFLKSMNIKEPIIKYELTPEFQNKQFSADDFKGRNIWQQTLYEFIFEALGYSQNKEIMKKLAQAANVEFLSRLGKGKEFVEQAEAALFNIAGLTPDVRTLPASETSEYTKQLAKDWLDIRELYDGERFDETDWQFFRLRPQNFPTIRIAGGVRLLDELLNKKLISVIIKKITEIRKPEVLINSLRTVFIVKSNGYWRSHYIFDKECDNYINYFIGSSRADEILINVIFPFFTLYFDVFGKTYLSKKLLETYSIFKQKSDNRIERTVAESLRLTEIAKQTIYAQGMIELYRSYCTKERCLECEIGKTVFNR